MPGQWTSKCDQQLINKYILRPTYLLVKSKSIVIFLVLDRWSTPQPPYCYSPHSPYCYSPQPPYCYAERRIDWLINQSIKQIVNQFSFIKCYISFWMFKIRLDQ